jgi:spermidine synthase
MNALADGWFSEISKMWPGQAQSLQVEEKLWDKQSDFQHNLVFKSKAWGTVFVLDGAIQVTDLDECSYHENMAHIPLFSHPDPKKVLIIGGGDGGAMREVLRHKSVESVVLCDIDAMVPEISKKFFPQLAAALDDPRSTVVIGDGFKFMEDKDNEYDVIIVDSSDPEGPASTLFGKEFYERCKRALRSDGILCTQAENIWIHMKLIKSMYDFIQTIGFKSVEYAVIQMPTYPNGSIGFFLCSKGKPVRDSPRPVPEDVQKELRYYDSEMHQAAFMLPVFVKRQLGILKN